jgi:RHS repeat-associated protein
LQPTQLQASKSGQNLLTLGFSFCAGGASSCATGNNGNLRSQSIGLPGLNLTQAYGYDNLNRLTGAVENGGTLQNYGYAGAGNRYVSQQGAGLPPLTLETPTGPSWFTSSNRINRWSYDANGNLTQLGVMVRSFTYDAEDRQASAAINGNTSTYTYDGNGLRVSKVVNGQTTVYVYDAFGNLAAEYGAPGASPCGTSTCYVTVDHLGSARMLADNTGSTVRRYDYLPFGEEILAGINGRTAGMGYLASPDAFLEKFTGQARAPETANVNSQAGLDYFGARYFSGSQGRFQSVDPFHAGAVAGDPQTWNAYVYVGNNPLSYTDPDGLGFWSSLLGILGQFFGGSGGLGSPQLGAPVPWGRGPEVWNERAPIGSVSPGGGLNTGGVFGSGNTGPFVFSFLPGTHYAMTKQAARNAGLPDQLAELIARAVVRVDKGTQGTDPAMPHMRIPVEDEAWHMLLEGNMGGGKSAAIRRRRPTFRANLRQVAILHFATGRFDREQPSSKNSPRVFHKRVLLHCCPKRLGYTLGEWVGQRE